MLFAVFIFAGLKPSGRFHMKYPFFFFFFFALNFLVPSLQVATVLHKGYTFTHVKSYYNNCHYLFITLKVNHKEREFGVCF